MKKVLVDTSVIVEFLRVKEEETLYEKVLGEKIQPVVSFITPAELWAGESVWESKEKAKFLEIVLSGVEVVFPGVSTLKLAGKLRAKYKISLLDAFVAAAAIEEKLSLATLNTKDFGKIKGVKLWRG